MSSVANSPKGGGCLLPRLTLRDIEGAERSCFEFKFVHYTTTAILVALDLCSTIYYVHTGHTLCACWSCYIVNLILFSLYVYWSHAFQPTPFAIRISLLVFSG